MRYFVSVELPRNLITKILKLQDKLREHDIKASYPSRENLHITLVFLGDKSEFEINGIIESLGRLHFKKFIVELAGAGVFPNMKNIRVIYIRAVSHEFFDLHKQVSASINMKSHNKFVGHVTLARVKSHKNIGLVKDFVEINSKTELGKFQVRSMSLKKSVLTSQGHWHETIKDFPLH